MTLPHYSFPSSPAFSCEAHRPRLSRSEPRRSRAALARRAAPSPARRLPRVRGGLRGVGFTRRGRRPREGGEARKRIVGRAEAARRSALEAFQDSPGHFRPLAMARPSAIAPITTADGRGGRVEARAAARRASSDRGWQADEERASCGLWERAECGRIRRSIGRDAPSRNGAWTWRSHKSNRRGACRLEARRERTASCLRRRRMKAISVARTNSPRQDWFLDD